MIVIVLMIVMLPPMAACAKGKSHRHSNLNNGTKLLVQNE